METDPQIEEINKRLDSHDSTIIKMIKRTKELQGQKSQVNFYCALSITVIIMHCVVWNHLKAKGQEEWVYLRDLKFNILTPVLTINLIHSPPLHQRYQLLDLYLL